MFRVPLVSSELSDPEEPYDIHGLHSDVNDVYEQLDRGKVDLEVAEETAENICKAFLLRKGDLLGVLLK
jgi:hypothetical protein